MPTCFVLAARYKELLQNGGALRRRHTRTWQQCTLLHTLSKKTAAILVYEHKDGDRWELVDAYQDGGIIKPHEITITAENKIIY